MNSAIFKGYDSIFAKRLRSLIDEKGTTIQAVAENISNMSGKKITRQAVSQYADGTTMPNAERVYYIAQYFGVSADYLLGLSDVQSTDTTVKSMCDYIGCNEAVIDNLQLIYENAIVNFEEDDEKDIDFSLNALNQILSAPYFAMLIDEIFWVAKFSYSLYINPISIIYKSHSEVISASKSIIKNLNISNNYELNLILKESLGKNTYIDFFEKEWILSSYKTDSSELSRIIDDDTSQCDLSRYRANKQLEKLLSIVDWRELLAKIDTKEKWLEYLNLTEKEVEDCKIKVQNANSLEELLEIGALSQDGYEREIEHMKSMKEVEEYFKMRNIELHNKEGEQSGKHTED